MSDTFVTIISIFTIATLLFIVPVMATANQNDSITQAHVQTVVSNFVDTVRKEGKITQESYNKLVEDLYSTGNSYDISIEIQKIDKNPQAKGYDSIGQNLYYSVYKNDILNTLKEDKPYLLKQGEYVIVSVKNTNITMGTGLKNVVYKIIGNDTTAIEASAAGLVITQIEEEYGDIPNIIKK